MTLGSYYPFRSIAPSEILGGVFDTLIPANNGGTLPQVGDNLVLDNTIRLAASDSSVDNYYVGYDITLSKVQANGKTYNQTRRIISYNGSERMATIDGVWDIGQEPESGDAYSIKLSYPDMRVTINPAMQVFDYVTSVRYGRGLNAETDFLLDTVKTTALKCDARSDVTVKLTAPRDVTAGDILVCYADRTSGDVLWEGEVRNDGTDVEYVTFTNCIGKLCHRWNSWKSFEVGQRMYYNGQMYKVQVAGTYPTAPTHTSGVVNGLNAEASSADIRLTGISAGGSYALTADISNGNPILSVNANGEEISGYSLYDSDSVDYWRHLGWDEHSQNSVTQYQTNFTIDTSVPMFDNINMMFEHFNGIFTYSQGKYAFSLEEAENTYIPVTQDDIIGKISFADSGSTKSFNSVSVSYTDPANNFESKNISLFSDTFLKQDRNVPKKGNMTVVGCTNYYNVRLLADSYLKKSRRGASIRMTLYPEFIVLEPGAVIGITYPRFSWSNKPFRINSMTLNPDGTIDVIADEYDDSFYNLSNMNKVRSTGSRTAISYTPMEAPSNLVATNSTNLNEQKDGILLQWDNASNLSAATDIEIQCSDNGQASMSVSNIHPSNEVTFSADHGLAVGDKIKAAQSQNGIIAGTTYYVTDVISNVRVELSLTPDGTPISGLTSSGSLDIEFTTHFIVGTVGYPETQFLHTFPNITDDTEKYYRIRYKVRKQ